MAAEFISSESAVTYHAPVGYYGQFGVPEKENTEVLEIMDDEDDDDQGDAAKNDDMIVDDISTRRPDVLKKPKKGFVDNELIERSDVEAEVVHADTEEDARSDGFIPSCELELDQDVISKNVSKALDSLGSDDLDVEKLMDYDEDVREKSKETYSDESSDVEKSVTKGVGVMKKVSANINVTKGEVVMKNFIKLSEDMNVTKVGLGAKRITNLKACGHGIPNEEYLKQFKPSSYFHFSKSIMSGSSSENENIANGSDSTSPAYKTADERSQTNEQTADDWHWRTEEIDNRGLWTAQRTVGKYGGVWLRKR